jgi:ribonuclease P protein component
MIGRKNRFHGYGSLRFVYQNGKTTRSNLLAIKSIENKKRSHYRLAVVVSKKIHKSAVVRNRIRRRVYEAVRQLEPPITKNYDIVVTVFSDQVATLEPGELTKTLQGLLRQARII